MKNRMISALLVLVLALGLWFPASGAYSTQTLTVSDWAQEEVTSAQKAGIIPEDLPSDYTQGITRAQFCHLGVALYETVMEKEITGRIQFSDTDDLNVEKMAYLGVVGGIGNNKFNPDSTITRQEAATILARLAETMGMELSEDKTPFTDVTSDWALSGVAKAYNAGIMNGTGNGLFNPLGIYTVEQSVVTMLRLYEMVQDTPDPEPTPTPTPTPTPEPTPKPTPEPEEAVLANGKPITEANVLEIINGLRGEYYEGMPWTNSNSYFSPAVRMTGYGCAGFALICSDAAFGNLPVTANHSDFDAIKAGDMLRINNDTHSVVVLEKRADSVVVTEGNFNRSIHWDREISRQSLEDGAFTVETRYPV